ncbi:MULTISPECIES: hypothetical protein [Rhizobium]|uniref:hypothetical protein n=1 Tax=unclassified Rhizobium TaxID=2613769 RepID=UPI0017B1C709|nr:MULTISPECIES: hypothetical protein [Rhizobium]MBB3521855.1 hypothetical protein [Rhizobium sp. BK456]MDF0660166.1 hypothetical protein [Rhizobium sp. BC49]ULJ77777.1 hypothetical protein MF410_17520 [Rhizobium sp. C104]
MTYAAFDDDFCSINRKKLMTFDATKAFALSPFPAFSMFSEKNIIEDTGIPKVFEYRSIISSEGILLPLSISERCDLEIPSFSASSTCFKSWKTLINLKASDNILRSLPCRYWVHGLSRRSEDIVAYSQYAIYGQSQPDDHLQHLRIFQLFPAPRDELLPARLCSTP